MVVNNNAYEIIVSFLFLFSIGCKEKVHSQTIYEGDSLIVNCYKTKPVKNDSKADTLRDFEFGEISLDDFLLDVTSGNEIIRYDSAMDYVTSFDYQREILLNSDCFTKLSNPDSCNLMDIYFNSGFATWIKKKSTIQYIRSYRKNIFKVGVVSVFEYRFNNVAEIEPHFMYLILNDQSEQDNRFRKDFSGIVILSDGLDWKYFADKNYSIPLFIETVRRSKEFYIPLYFDGFRFVPIGHFKSKNWIN